MDVLVVGGEHAFVTGPFASKLARVGVNLHTHWDWALRRPPGTLPKQCKGVVVVHDMVSHALSDAAKDLAVAADVPFALISRKFSAALPVLKQAGIAQIDALTIEDAPDQEEDDLSMNDLKTWISLSLEANFEAPDESLVAEAVAFDPTQPVDAVEALVRETRAAMRESWRKIHSNSAYAKSLSHTAGAWVRRQMPSVNMEDSTTLPMLRSKSVALFGVGVPESVLVDVGFHTWEIRGVMTRQRVRTAVAAGDAILRTADVQRFVEWIDKGTGPCPLQMKGGQPLEVVSVILRACPDMAPNMVGRVYRRITNSGLGPYYVAAVNWAHENSMDAPTVDAPTVDAPTVDAVEDSPSDAIDPRAAEVLRALFGGDKIPDDAATIARDARCALNAVDADAAAVADGREPTETAAMVSSRAADIIAARDLDALAAKQAEAEAALKAAEDAYLHAQEEFRLARERIANLRRQS